MFDTRVYYWDDGSWCHHKDLGTIGYKYGVYKTVDVPNDTTDEEIGKLIKKLLNRRKYENAFCFIGIWVVGWIWCIFCLSVDVNRAKRTLALGATGIY